MTTSTQSTTLVSDLARIVADADRGIISLVGSHGGHALIVGDIEESHMMGLIAVETEHGVVYLAPDAEVTIHEERPFDEEHEWLVEWAVDSNGSTPEVAAARVWSEMFGRTAAGADDACVFTVTDPETKTTHQIDLSEHDLELLV